MEKVKNEAAKLLGKRSAQRFKSMSEAQKKKYFQAVRAGKKVGEVGVYKSIDERS